MENPSLKPTPKSAVEIRGKEPGEGFRTRTVSKSSGVSVTPEQRNQLVAKAAYYRAERRGFAPGSELEDWLQAEAEVERTLRRSSAA